MNNFGTKNRGSRLLVIAASALCLASLSGCELRQDMANQPKAKPL